jgi:hypothetical protein
MEDFDMRPNKITIHHSLTEDSRTVSWGAIRRFQTTDPKYLFDDIGYHAGCENINGDYEILIGRMPNIQGAHVKHFNKDNFGFVFVGNYDKIEPPEEMLKKGVKFLGWLTEVFNIPIDNIFRHSDFDPNKTCPGKLFDIVKLRRMIYEDKSI